MAIFYHILSFVAKMLALIQLHIIFTPAKRKHPAHCPPTIHHTHTMLRCWRRWHRNKEGTFHLPHLISSSLKLASPLARPINKGACVGFAWVGKSEENKEGMEAFFFFFHFWPRPRQMEDPGLGIKFAPPQRKCQILNLCATEGTP